VPVIPPAASTRPSGSRVIVCARRVSCSEPVGFHEPACGSNTAAVASALSSGSPPPANSTRPVPSVTAFPVRPKEFAANGRSPTERQLPIVLSDPVTA